VSIRASGGWQTALADLSLILFMVTAAAVGQQPPGILPREGKGAAGAAPAPPVQSEPLAVYIDAPGAPSLAEWLDQQALDPRQQLTVTARYGTGPGAQERALASAARLVHEAGRAGRAARIVVEPGQGPARVDIAFDSPEELARGLLAVK
jgi:hypothetical protein